MGPSARPVADLSDPAAMIAALGLRPHPEGGHYLESYRSEAHIAETALPPGFSGGPRSCATAIQFMLVAGEFSALHRIASDELWFFHAGDPLEIVGLTRDEAPAQVWTLTAHRPMVVVPARVTFGARVCDGGRFALVSCVVAPGFDFRDFEMPTREALLAAFPSHRAWIEALSRE